MFSSKVANHAAGCGDPWHDGKRSCIIIIVNIIIIMLMIPVSGGIILLL